MSMSSLTNDDIHVSFEVYKRFLDTFKCVDSLCVNYARCPLIERKEQGCSCPAFSCKNQENFQTLQECLVKSGFLNQDLVEEHKTGPREYIFLQKDDEYQVRITPPKQ